MIFIDIHLYTEQKEVQEELLFTKFAANINYSYFLPSSVQPIFVQYAGFEKDIMKENVRFIMNIADNRPKLLLFIELFRKLKRHQPQVIMLHGMVWPWYIILAKLIFSRQVKLIIQNHAEKPAGIKKRWIQKLADSCISAYLFVSKEQAKPWLEKGIIRDETKVHEVMEGSTGFSMKNKQKFKEESGCSNVTLFLWVGRLDRNKDPLTVLKAFARYTTHNPRVKLWMVFSTTDLLDEVSQFILQNELSGYVSLIGKVPHAELDSYYNAADYFILGSHYEGSGYALCEAMACGCVPVVTDIPSFRNMLDEGECGYLFKAGNAEDLYAKLRSLDTNALEMIRKKVVTKFRNDLSFEGIGRRIGAVISALAQK